MLYVSVWALALSNLPGTTFTKRSLSDAEAAAMITRARAEGALMGVSSDDLVAPYQKRSFDLYVEVCDMLRARGIEITIQDFFNESFCNPLQFARVSQGHRLLVIDCGFEFNGAEARASKRLDATPQAPANVVEKVSTMFTLSPDTLAFHLFEDISR